MISISETCTEFRKALGFKGRLMLFILGFVGLLFPGWVAYVVIAGLAKCTKDQDMFKFLVQFADWTMTEEQLDALRHLIQQEINCAQIDGMEHGVWGWAEKQLDEGWQDLKDSFK